MTDLPTLIAKVKELLPKVTGGEWSKSVFCDTRPNGGNHVTFKVTPQRGPLGSLFEADADFISLLDPTTVSALLSRIEELEAEVTRYQELLDAAIDDYNNARNTALEEAASECIRHAKSEMPITRWDWHPWVKGNLQRVTRLSAKNRAKAFIRAAAFIRALKEVQP